MRCVHFIGFKPYTQDWWNAIHVFGRPDFIHRKWDERAAFGGEIDKENDILVFTGKEFEDIIHPFAVDDSAMGIPNDEELTRLGYPCGGEPCKKLLTIEEWLYLKK